MSAIDIENLLQAISGEAPCGQDLEYAPEFSELTQAVVCQPEQEYGDKIFEAKEPDWQDVQQRALKLFDQTKDLRVAVHLTAAMVHTSGLEGLCDGLALTHRLLQQYWDKVHPQLDAADGYDPTFRLNVLAGLNDPEGVVRAVREAYLLTLPVLGPLNVRTLLMAHGILPVPADQIAPPGVAEINTAVAAVDPAARSRLQDALQGAQTHIHGIGSYLIEKVGADRAPELGGLVGLIQQVANALAMPLGSEAPGAEAMPMTAQPITAIVTQVGAEIRSREDVNMWVDKICIYYAAQEPSSPVPLLLRRAQRLVSKGFIDIIRDLTPDAMPQVELIGGKGAERSD